MAVTLGGPVTADWLNRLAKSAHMPVPRYRKQFRL